MNDAQLLETVATSVARAMVAAAGGLKTPTPARPTRPSPTPPRPARPSRPTRAAASTVDRDRLAVAVHESGHSVAGVVLGAELRSAVLAPAGVTLRGGRAGQTNFSDQAAHVGPQVAYAGPWAQAKFAAGGRRPSMREFSAVMDSHHGCHDRSVLTAAGGIHEGAAVVTLLDRCWPAVLTVARKLHNVGEIHQEEVLAALGITDGGGPFSVQLASLRSGCRSVPAFAPA